MKIIKVKVEDAAYCVFKFASTTPYWNYVNVFGPCFDCNDQQIGKGDYTFAKVILEEATHNEGKKFAEIMSPFDMRSFEMVMAGCCPPGLVNEILEGGPG